MKRARGLALMILLPVTILSLNLVRTVPPAGDGPVFIAHSEENVLVELGQGFSQPGVYQFIDETTWLDVISLTGHDLNTDRLKPELLSGTVRNGRRVDLVLQGAVLEQLSLCWMKAAKRMALGIPLHPDRMTEEDWQALPGIGGKLASRIEQFRQDNGGFGSFVSLKQVKGIGVKRLESWRKYFSR